MKRVTGIGGIFFKCKDSNTMNEWYVKHLGFTQADDGGILFEWRNADNPGEKGYTVWGPFKRVLHTLSLLKIELWEPVDSVFTKMYEGKTIH